MSANRPEHQSPPGYATLRTTAEAGHSGAPASGGAPDAQYWRNEADKIDAMLQTLWTGFLDAPTNGLPTALADYVATYTSAMRLKLTLMGYSSVPGRNFKGSSQVIARAKTL